MSSSSLTLNTIASTSPSERAGLVHSPSLSKLPQAHKKPLRAQNVSAATVTPSRSAQSGMPRSASRSPIKSSLLLFPSISGPDAGPSNEKSKPSSPSKQAVADNATSEIDAHLLASLRVVAHKANLQLSDLLDAESQARFRREASEELEVLAGDVSVDRPAPDLAASPSSDASVLRSPLIAHTPPAGPPQPQPDTLTPPSESTPAPNTTPGIEDEETDTSLASPSVRAAARVFLLPTPPMPSRYLARPCGHACFPPQWPLHRLQRQARRVLHRRPCRHARARAQESAARVAWAEAHYAALHLAAPSAAAVLPDCSALHKAECRNDGVALLTDSDLDDIVSAVARMDLHHAQAELDEARPAVEVGEMGEVAELRAAQTALSTQLARRAAQVVANDATGRAGDGSDTHAARARAAKADLAALRARAAGMEWAQAQPPGRAPAPKRSPSCKTPRWKPIPSCCSARISAFATFSPHSPV